MFSFFVTTWVVVAFVRDLCELEGCISGKNKEESVACDSVFFILNDVEG